MTRKIARKGEGMTAQQRKALQRQRDAEGRQASAEKIDDTLVAVFVSVCQQLTNGLLAKAPTVPEVVALVASEFPAEQRIRVYARFGLEQETNDA